MDPFNGEHHLNTNGFLEGYINMTRHGKEHQKDNGSTLEAENRNPYIDMVMDAIGYPMNVDNKDCEEANPSVARFFQLLNDTDKHIWAGMKSIQSCWLYPNS